MNEINVYVGLCVYRDPHAITHACVIRDLYELPQVPGVHLWYSQIWNDALISRARSRMATHFLEEIESGNPRDVLMMIDHDIDWPAGAIQKLALQCAENNCIIGAVPPKRSFGQGTAAAFPKKYTSTELLKLKEEGAIIECVYLPTSFVCYPGELFLRLKKEVPWAAPGYHVFFQEKVAQIKIAPHITAHLDLSEDYYLCELAKPHGYTILADLSVDVGHWGQYRYTFADAFRDPPESQIPPIRKRGKS